MEQRNSNINEKGKTQVRRTLTRSNTEVMFEGGLNRSSEEDPVMGLERRVGVERSKGVLTTTRRRRKIIPTQTKVLPITYKMVMNAYKKVKRNKGGAGVDGQSLEDFAEDLQGNLYGLWNELTSNCYHSFAVREKAIPKKDGRMRKLGIPTVRDRIAQQVIKSYLEPRLDQLFHKNSYGYRSQKNAHEALGEVRRNCWQYDYVIDMDIKSFFDEVNHDLLNLALKKHIPEQWILKLLNHWLCTPIMEETGELRIRLGKGTPQGGVISPLLSNLYLHYVLDEWLVREYEGVKFVRYADDVIIHCKTGKEAERVLEGVKERMKKCKLELHPEKTHIVKCGRKGGKDAGCKYGLTFEFLGHRFQPQEAQGKGGKLFRSYNCAISPKSEKKITEELRTSNFQCWTTKTIEEIAEKFNPKLRGWLNYYGALEQRRVRRIFDRFNLRLLRWVIKKYGRFKKSYRKARKWLQRLATEKRTLFYHWQKGYIYS